MLSFDPDGVEFPLGSFVGGKFQNGSGSEIELLRPSDGKVLGSVRELSHQDMDAALAQADDVRRRSGWSDGDPRRRGEVLRRWAELVEQHMEEIARIEAMSTSRPISETRGRDIPVVAKLLRFFSECADKGHGLVLETPKSLLNITENEPWGVVLAISPWNVPALLAMAKVAPALAAGNAVVLKPSELTPLSMLKIAELSVEAGLPAGLFTVLVGRGQTVGDYCVRHPLVSYISFTGSTATGAAIMSAAAYSGMKPVSMELGGKSPQIVFADAPDIDNVAELVALGISRNSGQICFAGSRLVVEESISELLVEKVAERLKQVTPGPTWAENTDLPPIISRAQADRIESLISKGVKAGARIRIGGERFERDGGEFFMPTILGDMTPDNEALREEIFGPVLAVQTFRGFDEAVSQAAHPLYGLTASIYTRDINKAITMARRTEAGTIWINGYGRGHDLTSPFGGFKQSGFGKDFGLAGFTKYQRSKSINVFVSDPADA